MCVAAAVTWAGAVGQPSRDVRGLPSSMLAVDTIMRGPKLVGTAPTAIRWARDSSKIYFTWQRPQETRTSTWTVNRDGTGLRQLSPEEARNVSDVLPPGQLDRARKRLVTAQGGDIVVIDVASGTRRPLTRTAANETSPRWARNDTAVTFVRDDNLFLASVDSSGPALLQLTDIVAADAPPTAAASPRGEGAGRGRGRGGSQAARGAQAVAEETASQRILREEELRLIDHLKRQEEEQAAARAAGPPTPPEEPIARLQLGPRQTLARMQLSGDETFVWLGIDERPEGTARPQDVPNYVTRSAYPEAIPGRTNVGDVQAHRRLAMLDLKSGKTVWADASEFAGAESKTAASDPDVPRIVDWTMPAVSDDGSQSVVAVRSQDNKDRWLVKVDPASGKATVLDRLHDDAWIREIPIGGFGPENETGIAWLPDNRRFVFLSEKSGWMHLYVMDAEAGRWRPRRP